MRRHLVGTVSLICEWSHTMVVGLPVIITDTYSIFPYSIQPKERDEAIAPADL